MTESNENGNGSSNGQATTTSERIGQNAFLLAVARVSMALALPAVTLISTLGASYLNEKFQAMNEKIASNQVQMSEKVAELKSSATTRDVNTDRIIDKLEETISKLSDKMIQVETRQTQEADNFNRFQTAVLLRLDRFQDSQINMSNAIAAMTAILQAKEVSRRDSTTSTPQRSVQ